MKYCGSIGYAVTEETTPGIWEETITEKTYYGDVIRNSAGNRAGEYLNDNLTISNQISILADTYAYQNCHLMKYAEFNGIKWKISNIEIQRPRLILTLGGEYIEESS